MSNEFVTSNGKFTTAQINGQKKMVFLPRVTKIRSIEKVSENNPYLFEVNYDYIDYKFADEFFKRNNTPLWGSCSSCRNGNFYGRNFDWFFNEDAEFVVRVPSINGRAASVGVTFKYGFTAEEAAKKIIDDNYKILPFYTLDGVNEYGVFCNTNVVPVADNPSKTTKTGKEGDPEYSMNMICRYVLDHFTTAAAAVNALQNNIRIVAAKELATGGYEAHWMIGDANETYVVEILNNIVVSTPINIMTNFYTNGVIRNSDGSLYSIKDNSEGSYPAQNINKLRSYSDGVERFNILNAGVNNVTSVVDMKALMQDIWYTEMYDTSKFEDDSFWYTELLEPERADISSAVALTITETMLSSCSRQGIPIRPIIRLPCL